MRSILGVRVRMVFKFISLAVSVLILAACTRQQEASTVKFRLPETSTQKNSAIHGLSQSYWGLSEPAALDEVTCYAVTVSKSDSAIQCSRPNSAGIISISQLSGLYPAGSNVELSVPSGPDQTLRLLGLKATSLDACNEKALEITDFSMFSTPQVLAEHTLDLEPGAVEIIMNLKLDPSQKIESCNGEAFAFGPKVAAPIYSGVVINSPVAGSYVNTLNQTNFNISGTCFPDESIVDLYHGVTPLGSTDCSAGLWNSSLDLSLISDGSFELTAGGLLGGQHSLNYIKDVTPPMISITNPLAGATIDSSNEDNFVVNGTCTEDGRDVVVTGSTSVTGSCNSGVWSVTLDYSMVAPGTVNLFVGHTDAAGNNSAQASRTFQKQPPAPFVTMVTGPAGFFKTGDSLLIEITFNESVIVTGAPVLRLETSATNQFANYVSGSGTPYLEFQYYVSAGDTSLDLDYESTTALFENGGSIESSSAVPALLTLPPLGSPASLSGTSNIIIDTQPPINPSIFIESDQPYIMNPVGMLSLSVNDADEMYVTNMAGCASGGSWEPFASSKSWSLPMMNGTNTVFAKYRDTAGNESSCVSDSIIHDNIAPTLSGPFIGGRFASYQNPIGIATRSDGVIFIAEPGAHVIRKIEDGISTVYAGQLNTPGILDGSQAAALFKAPTGVALDEFENLYVADSMNHVIRKIDSTTGNVTTLAGMMNAPGPIDGIGNAAKFHLPFALATDSSNNLYVADKNNHAIRKIDTTTGNVTTVAGTLGTMGSDDGPIGSAKFKHPSGISVDASGLIYVADTENHTIRRVDLGGITSTVAGVAGVSGSSDGNGTSSRFSSPTGLAISNSGTLYIADSMNHTIRSMDSGMNISTYVGGAGISGATDGNGTAARFSSPKGLALDSADNLFIADSHNKKIRKMDPALEVTTFKAVAGIPGGPEFHLENTASPVFTWPMATDSGSGLSRYQAALGTYFGGDDIIPWSDISQTTTHGFVGVNLIESATYFYSVRAVDVAGNFSSQLSSSAWFQGCPTNYSKVPPLSSYIGHPFCVGIYEAKNQAGIAVSSPAGAPWVNINRPQAHNACTNNGSGYKLMRNEHWQAIARDLEAVDQNWTGSAVGLGSLFQGHTDSSPPTACDATQPNVDANCTAAGVDPNQTRHLYLSNNQIIWDFAGNAFEWVSSEIGTDHYGPDAAFISQITTAGWTNMDLQGRTAKAAFGPAGDYLSHNSPPYGGFGHAAGLTSPYPSNAIIRGGSYNSMDEGGIFAVDLTKTPSYMSNQIGFRCVYSP